MSSENMQGFCLLVLRDPNLQNELINLSDREEFIRQVLISAANSGLEISRDDVERKCGKTENSGWKDGYKNF
jgi:hypothetical protein